MIDKYLLKPLQYDTLISSLIIVCVLFSAHLNFLTIPNFNFINKILADLSTVSFTSLGFILTILSVLITFKNNSNKQEKLKNYKSAFDLFFETNLYSKTTNLFKNSIIILFITSILSFFIRLFSINVSNYILFAFCLALVFFILGSLFRCFLVLNQILKLQNK
mgnify:CR=1 FL=1